MFFNIIRHNSTLFAHIRTKSTRLAHSVSVDLPYRSKHHLAKYSLLNKNSSRSLGNELILVLSLAKLSSGEIFTTHSRIRHFRPTKYRPIQNVAFVTKYHYLFSGMSKRETEMVCSVKKYDPLHESLLNLMRLSLNCTFEAANIKSRL